MVASLGITTVCVLHDLALIPKFADQTVLLNEAAVVVKGPTKDALNAAAVETVFGIELLKFPHPRGGHFVSALDIPIAKSNPLITISSKSSILYAIPPPEPPRVNDGLINTGKPIFF